MCSLQPLPSDDTAVLITSGISCAANPKPRPNNQPGDKWFIWKWCRHPPSLFVALADTRLTVRDTIKPPCNWENWIKYVAPALTELRRNSVKGNKKIKAPPWGGSLANTALHTQHLINILYVDDDLTYSRPLTPSNPEWTIPSKTGLRQSQDEARGSEWQIGFHRGIH